MSPHDPISEARIEALLAERDPTFSPPPFDPAALAVLGAAGGGSDGLPTPHRRLLMRANGAWLFGGALHLFGACDQPPWHALSAWNAPATWRDAYGHLAEGLAFFAEDAFGDQYAYTGRGGEVVCFTAELGRIERVAPTFGDWIDALLTDPAAVLPIAAVSAQAAAGRPLKPGQQLYAWPPLFSPEAEAGVTVGHVDALEAMRFRGALALRVHGQPPGTTFELTLG